jgi:hypothetical protein
MCSFRTRVPAVPSCPAGRLQSARPQRRSGSWRLIRASHHCCVRARLR